MELEGFKELKEQNIALKKEFNEVNKEMLKWKGFFEKISKEQGINPENLRDAYFGY